MSNFRQPAGPQLRAIAVGFTSGYRWRTAHGEWGQWVRATPGVIRVRLGDAHFVVAPHQLIWIPAQCPHEVWMAGRGVLQRVYLRGAAARRMPSTPRVLALSPLLHELFRRVHRCGTLDRRRPAERRLIDLLVDESVAEPVAPWVLPMPRDARALRAATALRAGWTGSLASLGREAGASLRTLERLFHEETGLSLGAWRRRARMMQAASRLADGATVTAVALAVGYASASAFVAAFRQATGASPGQWTRVRRR